MGRREEIYNMRNYEIAVVLHPDLEIDLAATLEKVEGIAVIDKRRIAIVNDNDFQIDGPTDFKTGLTPFNKEPSQLLLIEVDHDLY